MKIKRTLLLRTTNFIHLMWHHIQYDSRALKEFAHLLLGRLILEAGVLEVISTHGLVFVIGGAQKLYGFLDGHCTAVYLVTTYSMLKRNAALIEFLAEKATSVLVVIRKESNTKCKILSHKPCCESLLHFSVSKKK